MWNGTIYKYTAFGLVLESEFLIPQVRVADPDAVVDVRIIHSDLSEHRLPDGTYDDSDEKRMLFIEEMAFFRVMGRDLIEVEIIGNPDDPMLPVYLMGSCMGMILHHRGFLPIHGSCVTNGEQSIILTGNSGAGKSTLAAEFLHQGWKLLSDDVSVLKNLSSSEPVVQSSYPSQKLWGDSLEAYRGEKDNVHSLYARNNENKFGVSVEHSFFEGTAPLSLIVRLIPHEMYPTQIKELKGMEKVDQLLRNTYRSYMIEDDRRSEHFQRCVDLGQKVRMAFVVRNTGEESAEKIYRLVVGFLEG